jgi:hypothetical protein
MSIDLGQIWNAVQNAISTIANIISYLYGYVSNIVNTGQGIAVGLSYLTSGLWDAVLKGSDAIRQGFEALMKPLREGLIYLGTIIVNIMGSAWSALSSSIGYIGSAIYSFGSWVFAGVQYANRVLNAVLFRLWSGFIDSVNNAFSNIANWWNNLANSVNTWFTNLMKTIRNKIKLTIMTDVSLYFGWKAIESSFNSASISKLPFALLGVVSSPFIGYIFGEIADALIPTPSTPEFPLIPPISPMSITLPSIEAPPEPSVTMPYIPSVPSVLVGVGTTSEATGIYITNVNIAISTSIAVTPTFESIGESSQTPSPSVTVTTESITP